MIINGNYKFIDFESLKPKFINAFTKYYGEIYRKDITDRINKIKYFPYHSISFVSDYYNQFINVLHREELCGIFFESIGVDRTPELEDLIMTKNYDENPEIFMAVCGGYDVENCMALTREGREYIVELRNQIREAFDIPGDDYEVYIEIEKLYKKYVQAEREVGMRHKCDVVEDVEQFTKNSIEAMREYLRQAKDIGYDVTFDDIAIVTKDNYTPNDSYALRSRHLLFGDELMEKGTIAAFTSENNEKLKNGSEYEKTNIIMDRIKYLDAFHTKFKYIDQDELYEPTDDDTFKDRLYQEYEYQKTMPVEVQYVDYFNYNLEQIKKNYKKGQFFPTEMADKLEELRYNAIQEIVTDCKFYNNREPYPVDFDLDFFTIYDYKDRKMYEPFSDIYMNEDNNLSEEALLKILIHEVNHAVGHGVPQIINTKNSTFTNKSGINHIVRKKDDSDKLHFDYPSPLYFCPVMQRIEENLNERQTEEILDILLAYHDIEFGYEKDKVNSNPKDDYSCGYTTYNFLTDEFYEIFHDAIKDNKVDSTFKFYFQHDLVTSKSAKIIAHIKNKLNRLGNPEYSNEGVVDFYKVEKLAKLCDEFFNNVYPIIDEKFKETGRQVKMEDLDDKMKVFIMKLVDRKDKIIEEMQKDLYRVNLPNYRVQDKIIEENVK